jgi:TIR domain-containing protein
MGCDVFISYTHIKNTRETRYAVTKFREHLESELKQQIRNNITVFQDISDICAGDEWERRIKEELASARLLLVLLSPTWLTSEWCQKECELFLKGPPTGREIVPILWDKVEGINLTPEQAALLAKVREHQVLTWDERKYANWKYADWSSPAPNRALGRFAEQLKPKLL